MSLNKYRLRYPLEIPEKCREQKMEEFLHDIKFSKNKFSFFETDEGVPNIVGTELNGDLFETVVVLMSNYSDVYDFFRLAVIGTERLKKNYKKGMATLEDIKKYCKENFHHLIPKNEQ